MFHLKIQLLLDQGRYADAEAAIREALRDSMEDEYLFFLLAVTLLNQGKPKEAEKAARESILLEPMFDTGHFILSRALLAQEKKKEALTAINEALEINPEDAENFSQKAQIYLDWDKAEKSLEAAEAGLAIYPEHEGCRFFRSITLEKLGRKEEADLESLGLLTDNPDDDENHSARGWVLAQRGDSSAAEKHFVEALRINPLSGDARSGLAFTFKMRSPILGSFLKALIWLEKIPVWWVLIGVIVVLRIGKKLTSSDMPAPIPQLASAVQIVIWSFFVIALLINPLFNLILSRSKTARHALSDDELKGVRWGLPPLIIAGIFLLLWMLRGGSSSAPLHAVAWAAVAVLAYETFETQSLWVRKRLALIGWAALSVALWIEIFAWVILPLESIALINQLQQIQAGDEEAIKNLVERIAELAKKSIRLVFFPSMALWILASLSDNLREFLTRRAPD